MFLSFWYLAFRCVLQLVLLRRRSTEFKQLEIVVLRHQLAVLHRQADLWGAQNSIFPANQMFFDQSAEFTHPTGRELESRRRLGAATPRASCEPTEARR